MQSLPCVLRCIVFINLYIAMYGTLNPQPYRHSDSQSVAQVDEEGNSIDFESLLSQLLEVIITIVSNQRFRNLLEPVVPQLVYVTIGTFLHSPSGVLF